MKSFEKHILLWGFTPDEAKQLENVLKKKFIIIYYTSPDDLLDHSEENSLLLLDQEVFKVYTLSTVSDVLKKKELPTILLIDSQSSNSYLEILQKLDVSHAIAKHDHYFPLLFHSINKAFDEFFLQKKMMLGLQQFKKKLDETEKELENTKEKLAKRPLPMQKEDILEEIIVIFKRGEIELPSHPKLGLKFKKLLDQGGSLKDIADLLRQDAAISSKLISISNSPFYRGISNNKTLEQAMGRLGLSTTKQYVDVILNKTLYMSGRKEFVDIIEKLWEHTLSCAYASQIIAERLKLDLQDDAFTLGLLHDIGKLVLLHTVVELQKRKKLGENIDQSELFMTINNYHGKFGASLLKRWKFSDNFINVAAYHNNLSDADPISKSLLVVSFSNLLVKSMGYALSATDGIDLEKEQSAILLKLTSEDIRELSEKVEARMNEFKNFFN